MRRFPHLQTLPAVRWKLQNLEKLKKSNGARFAAQHDLLVEGYDSM